MKAYNKAKLAPRHYLNLRREVCVLTHLRELGCAANLGMTRAPPAPRGRDRGWGFGAAGVGGGGVRRPPWPAPGAAPRHAAPRHVWRAPALRRILALLFPHPSPRPTHPPAHPPNRSTPGVVQLMHADETPDAVLLFFRAARGGDMYRSIRTGAWDEARLCQRVRAQGAGARRPHGGRAGRRAAPLARPAAAGGFEGPSAPVGGSVSPGAPALPSPELECVCAGGGAAAPGPRRAARARIRPQGHQVSAQPRARAPLIAARHVRHAVRPCPLPAARRAREGRRLPPSSTCPQTHTHMHAHPPCPQA